jgi:LacI family transcriptional regulator
VGGRIGRNHFDLKILSGLLTTGRFFAKLYVNANGSAHGSDNGTPSEYPVANSTHFTIKQVAEKAGVSIQTVSRVLNNRPDVSPETRQRVQQLIDELGYQPFASARGLASKRTYTLGLIASDFSDYWFSQVVTGAEIEAHEHGYFFMLGSTGCNPQDEPKFLRLLTQRHIEGVLFVRAGCPDDLEHLRNLQKSGIPIVSTGFYLPDAEFSVVEVDNVDGGRKATQHLVELGHTQIALICGPADWKSVSDRTEGYMQALASASIAQNPDLIVHGTSWLHRSGYGAMKELLARGAPLTAVFAHNDRIAKGAISAIHEAGLKVPEDISIVGYDDIPEAEFSDPPLTTIRQPMREVGKAAARLLVEMVENSDARPTQILYETELVIRSSCIHRKS